MSALSVGAINHSLIQLWLWQVEGWQLILLGALIGFLSFLMGLLRISDFKK